MRLPIVSVSAECFFPYIAGYASHDRAERSCTVAEIGRQVHIAIVERVSQRQHGFHIAGDGDIAREEQRISVKLAFQKGQQHDERAFNGRIRLEGGILPENGNTRFARLYQKGEGQIGRAEAETLVHMLAEPFKQAGMGTDHLMEHARYQRVEEKWRNQPGWSSHSLRNFHHCQLQIWPGAAVLNNDVCLQSAQTLTATRVLMVPAELVREQMSEDPAFMHAVVFELARAYRRLVKELKAQKLRSCAQRLANWIVKESLANDGADVVTIPYEKRILAAYLGMTPENLSRSFANLASHGVHVQASAIRITDKAGLLQFAAPSSLIDQEEPTRPA